MWKKLVSIRTVKDQALNHFPQFILRLSKVDSSSNHRNSSHSSLKEDMSIKMLKWFRVCILTLQHECLNPKGKLFRPHLWSPIFLQPTASTSHYRTQLWLKRLFYVFCFLSVMLVLYYTLYVVFLPVVIVHRWSIHGNIGVWMHRAGVSNSF